MKSKVAVVKCASYERKDVFPAVSRGISLLGGIEKFVQKRERILLKPNLLQGGSPENCITTHPEVFRAIAEICIEAGANLSFGDSPGFGNPEKVAEKSGILSVANDLKIPLADFEKGESVSFPDGFQNKQFVIAKGILSAEGIISLPKLKTHSLTRITGAVKNQFGYIPGVLKAEFHVKLPNADSFSKMLVDLTALIKPRLYVMDAIQAMDGNGPSGGDPYPLNLLLLSDDPVAIDSVACHIINVKPGRVPTIKYGEEFKLGFSRLEDITILGDDIDSFYSPDFRVERAPGMQINKASKYRFLKNILVSKPAVDSQNCDRCGVCVNQCPVNPKALFWLNEDHHDSPSFDYKKCIRCYCCQEVCPRGAIYVKTPIIRRLLNFLIA